ncbi:uncharacterized protein [Clytia hemisphaerica]|uniref:uncharacterized protein n=1 Tax=Clytia hemisphaerica TaxID=252671 RepID=UPI0034D6DEA0
MDSDVVDNPTNSTRPLIDNIAQVTLLSFYPINFIFSAIGLITLYRYIKNENGPTTPFIQMVVRITMVGVFLGMPMEWYTLLVRFSFASRLTCIIIRLVSYLSHFMSSLVNMLIISAMLLHRYIKFKNQDIDGFTKHIRLYIAVSVGAGIISLVPITWELWRYFETDDTQCNVVVVDAKIECHLDKPCAVMVTTVVVTMVTTFTNVAIGITTKGIKKIIKAGDERANNALQIKRRTNTARIEATHFLWYLFTIGWVPYGVSRLFIFTQPTHQVFQTVGAICHALSTSIFSIIPVVFYKMDGKFASFVGNIFSTHQEVDARKEDQNSTNKASDE